MTLWKLTTAAGVAVSLGLCIALFLTSSEVTSLRDDLQTANENLAQAKTNVATLSTSLAEQNAAIDAMSAEHARRVAALEQHLVAARAETAKAQDRAASILAYIPVGGSVCDRMLDVDARFLETLK